MRSCNLCKRGMSCFLTVLFFGVFLWSEAWAQLTLLHVGHASVNSRMSPLWVAAKEGFFKKQGFDVRVVNIRGGTQVTQALLGGGLDIAYSDPPATIAAIAAGAPLVEIMATATVMPYYLLGAPAVKTVADLKGKRVGSSGLGLSASRLAIIVGLKYLGVDPDRDKITLVAAGTEPERLAGLASGALGGTVVAPEFRSRIEQLGLNVLADLRAMPIPWEVGNVVTARKFLQNQRDVVERVIKALLEGNAYVLNRTYRPQLLEVLKLRLGLKSTQDAVGAYEDTVKYYVLKKPYPYREGLQSIIAEVGKVLPAAAGLKYEDVADPSIIEKLDKGGYIGSLYQ
jgi:ABC-type nitrate/sulfonate/bicarbonate transport system substrate-binding protein